MRAVLVGEISDDHSAALEDELHQFLVSAHLLLHITIINRIYELVISGSLHEIGVALHDHIVQVLLLLPAP
jgi:hypothetical protein